MSSEESASGGNTIQLDTLSLDQLQQLQQQQEGRMQIFTNRYAQLRSAAARLQQSSIAVEELKAGQDDDDTATTKEVFVPLTESVYVPGKIQLLQPDAKDLLVELGTGYFVEKTAQETQEYLERKMKLVDANSDNGAFVVVSVCIMLSYFVHHLKFFLFFPYLTVAIAVQGTQKNLESIAMAAQGKLMEINARQQGRIHREKEAANNN